jgi:DNA repair protein RadC
MNKSIDDIPEEDRPREKLLRKGAAALSDQELMAILLGSGTSGMDVMTLSGKLARLIDEKGLDVKAEDLTQFAGVGAAKATLILAAIEFARRRIKPEGAKIATPADLLPHVRHYADRKQEHFLCATINGANELLNIRVVSIGLIDRAPVHPREVFADALSDRASAVIVAHNHPSGGLEPSPGDVHITAQLKSAGEILGIDLLDHIIFNRTGYFSFLEDGRLAGTEGVS